MFQVGYTSISTNVNNAPRDPRGPSAGPARRSSPGGTASAARRQGLRSDALPVMTRTGAGIDMELI